jgi:hypothetical protein
LDDLKEWRGLQTFTRLRQNPNTRGADDLEISGDGLTQARPVFLALLGSGRPAMNPAQSSASQAKGSFDLDKSIDRCGSERDRKGRS